MSISIRKATKADAGTIANFQLKMAKETENLDLDITVLNKGVEAVFTDSSKGFYYVAEVTGKPVASLMITFEWSDWRNGLIWWIQSVYVTPEQRQLGVFQKMYRYIKDQVIEQNIRGLRLYVDITNSRAQKVYEKIGMNGEHYKMYEWMNAME